MVGRIVVTQLIVSENCSSGELMSAHCYVYFDDNNAVVKRIC